MDEKTRAEFDKQQSKRQKPDCFGEWESCPKCSHCWFRPDCKTEKPAEKKAEPKTEDTPAEYSKSEIMEMLDDLGIEYDKRCGVAKLSALLNEAMK